MSEATPKKHPNLYRRITASVPLLVTVIVHVVLIGVAGYFVVSEQIIGKKKTFEAPPPSDSSPSQKQVEHRLQVARKGGGGGASSPVSASRIYSTAENALQMPALPELPQVGTSALGGMGFGSGIGVGGGAGGFNTGLGTTGGTGIGFMSMSFLGTTSQRASKVVFIVDVGTNLLDIRKGGFEAFQIIRDEMSKLISRLPPSAEFGVILFESGQWDERGGALALFERNLLPATTANKQRFFEWVKPVNTSLNNLGLRSVGRRIGWTAKELPNAGLDDNLIAPIWTRAFRASLEMQPDTVFIVTGSAGRPGRKVSETELARRKKAHEDYVADLKRQGLDLDAIAAARGRALAKAKAELDAVNAKLVAAGKPPFVIRDTRRIFDGDFQAALKKVGATITLDKTGWTNKQGQLIWGSGYSDWENAEFSEVIMHISQLQRALVKDRAALNIFLFVGPNEQPKEAMENLGKASSRNGGKFELITTQRLKEIAKREEEQQKK